MNQKGALIVLWPFNALKNKLFIKYKNNVVVVGTINNGDKKEYRNIHKYYTINNKYSIGEFLLISRYNV
tara:strand:- start:102 stop:308 length:207 start_codon:yes stop_codon:yes gene_type:complete